MFTLPAPPLPKRRLPLEPLLHCFGDNTGAFARAAGVSQRTVQRWCHEGLSFIRADEVCCKVKEVPAHVWLDWHLDDEDFD